MQLRNEDYVKIAAYDKSQVRKCGIWSKGATVYD